MVLMDPTPGGRSPPRTSTKYRPQELSQTSDCPRSLYTSSRLQARSVTKRNERHDLEADNHHEGTDSEHCVDGINVTSIQTSGDRDVIYVYAAGVNSSQETTVEDEDLDKCEGSQSNGLMRQGEDAQEGRKCKMGKVTKNVGFKDPKVGGNSSQETIVVDRNLEGCEENQSNGLMRQSEDSQEGREYKTGKVTKDVGFKDPGPENQTFSFGSDGSDYSHFPSAGVPGRVGGVRDMVAETVRQVKVAGIGGKESVDGVSPPVVHGGKLVVDEGRNSVDIANDTADTVEPASEADRTIQLEGKVLQNHRILVDSGETVSTNDRPSQLPKNTLRNSHVLKDSADFKSLDQKLMQNIGQDNQYQLKDTDDEIDEFTKVSNISERNPSNSQDLNDDTASDFSMESQYDSDDEGVLQEKASASCNIVANMNANGTDVCNSTMKNKNRIHISSSTTSQDCTNESHVQNTESLMAGVGQDMTLCHDGDLDQEMDESIKAHDENTSETDTLMPVVIKTEPELSLSEIPCDKKDWSSFNGRRRKLKEEETDSLMPAKRMKKNLKSHVNQVGICTTRSSDRVPVTKSSSTSYSCKVCEKDFLKETKLNMHLKIHIRNGELQCAMCNKKFKSAGRFKSHKCKSSVYFECGICEQVFTERNKLKDHVDSHREIPEMNFGCGVCELTFTEAISLNIHLQTHEGKKFQCKLCDKTFKGSKSLENHNRKEHRDTFKCKICGKQFGKQTSLYAHAKLHMKRQRFGCKQCGKRFSKFIDMRIHLRTHKRWKCKTCSENFETRTQLLEHKVVHETMYECANCDFTCVSEAVIKTHMTSHEETKSFSCTECDKSYRSLKWLKNHCEKSHRKQYKCDVCSEEFEDVDSLSSHSKIHTSEDNFKCEVCGVRFDDNKHLKKHMKIHKRWKCRRCDIDFETQEELKIHRDQHKRPFRCVACDFASKTASELKNHMLGHDDIDEFMCKICDKTFLTETALYNHQLTHINLKRFTCEFCGSGFTHRSTLIIHKRVHTGERPYPCTMCDKAFIEKSALRSHMISHSSERKHRCDQCGKTFPHKCSLVRHVRIHNEEKPFQCEQCKKTFGQSTQLKRHKRTHTGEKPFKCEDCGLRFGYVETLRSHRRIHNDITIYCKLCEKSFSTTVHLKRHMKTHTGEVDFVCDMCGEGFIRKDYFMKHFKSHEKKSEKEQAGNVKSLSKK